MTVRRVGSVLALGVYQVRWARRRCDDCLSDDRVSCRPVVAGDDMGAGDGWVCLAHWRCSDACVSSGCHWSERCGRERAKSDLLDLRLRGEDDDSDAVDLALECLSHLTQALKEGWADIAEEARDSLVALLADVEDIPPSLVAALAQDDR